MNVNNKHILVVDDNKTYARQLAESLQEFWSVEIAFSEKEFNKKFVPYKFDLIFLDLRLKKGREGIDLLQHIIAEDPSAAVIVISGYGDIAIAVEVLQKGAKTFLEKPKVSFEEIKIRAEHVFKENTAERRIRQLEASLETDEIIGDDSKILKTRELIQLVGEDGQASVLIRGETGTGKELVAKAIHRVGIRKKRPFVSVSLSDNTSTITSVLFGHEKGAFTDAKSKHYGCFEQAHKGILFLDEIGDLPSDVQTKLLRVIEQKTFRRMGGNVDIHVDFQLISATNRPLEELIDNGKFREDLYYRFKGFGIQLAPLRERGSDIPLLAQYFLHQIYSHGRTPAKKFATNAIQLINDYSWPGNVRELKSVIESASLRCRLEGKEKITLEHIKPLLMEKRLTNQELSSDDVFKVLADTELAMIEKALLQTGSKKTKAWKLLNYPDRYSMLRRVKNILKNPSHLSLFEKYPEVKKAYYKQFENLI